MRMLTPPSRTLAEQAVRHDEGTEREFIHPILKQRGQTMNVNEIGLAFLN
jgi:hypothetical protein